MVATHADSSKPKFTYITYQDNIMSLTIETDLKDIFAQFQKQFEQMDRRFERMDQRFERMEQSLNDLKVGQTEIKGKIDTLDERLTGKINALDERLTGQIKTLDAKVDGLSTRGGCYRY
jgi:chromosome segregation ATPase